MLVAIGQITSILVGLGGIGASLWQLSRSKRKVAEEERIRTLLLGTLSENQRELLEREHQVLVADIYAAHKVGLGRFLPCWAGIVISLTIGASTAWEFVEAAYEGSSLLLEMCVSLFGATALLLIVGTLGRQLQVKRVGYYRLFLKDYAAAESLEWRDDPEYREAAAWRSWSRTKLSTLLLAVVWMAALWAVGWRRQEPVPAEVLVPALVAPVAAVMILTWKLAAEAQFDAQWRSKNQP